MINLDKIISEPFKEENLNSLTSDEIKQYLTASVMGKKIVHVETVDSTNTYAKSIAITEQEGTVITCENQTSGRGRLGRQWESKSKGVCMSIILKPRINLADVSKITQVCAAAVSLSLEELGIDAEIKWPNDLMINNKKICGILTEMESSNSEVNYVVAGIGINVNNSSSDFTDVIKNTATSLKIETGKNFKRSLIAAKILNNFEILYYEFVKNNNFDESLDICRKKSNVIGKNINLIKNGNATSAKAVNIGKDGELIVQYESGEIDTVISGEISVRTV